MEEKERIFEKLLDEEVWISLGYEGISREAVKEGVLKKANKIPTTQFQCLLEKSIAELKSV